MYTSFDVCGIVRVVLYELDRPHLFVEIYFGVEICILWVWMIDIVYYFL